MAISPHLNPANSMGLDGFALPVRECWMGEWKTTKLGKILELHYGKSLPESKRNTGNVPVYSSGGLTGRHDKPLVNSKGIIIGRKGTVGAVYKSDHPFFAIDTVYFVLPNEKYQFNYIYYLLKTLGLENLNEDSAVPGLNRNTAYDLEISLPPLPEQKAIAEVLSSLDDKIDLLHRQNKTLEGMAEVLFQNSLGNADSYGTVEEIIEFNPKISMKKGTLAPYLEMSNVSTTSANPDNWYYREFNSGMRFQNMDTLFARITPCLENGKSCFVNFLKEDQVGWGSTEFIVMRTKESYHPFISYLIAKDQDFRDFAIGCMTGSSGRQRAQADSLKGFEIPIPSAVALAVLNQSLEEITSKLRNNYYQVCSLTNLRETLLPKLMGGEVRVKP